MALLAPRNRHGHPYLCGMKLLSAQQLQEWDAYTIREEPVSAADLMERAATRCVHWLQGSLPPKVRVHIFCGKGNNGGDGTAIARLLIHAGFHPITYILETGAAGTVDFHVHLLKLQQLTADIFFVASPEEMPIVHDNEYVIDALFGSGLNRPLQGLSAALVEHINLSGATVIAIDVPSGMFIDKSSGTNPVVRADYTLTFQSLKRCFMAPENAANAGQVAVMDIGLLPSFVEGAPTSFFVSTQEMVRPMMRPRKDFSHKGDFGHALLVAGNLGKMGAAVLATRGCLRSGSGLLTVNVPQPEAAILHGTAPEAMVQQREEKNGQLETFSAIGIGPGLGTGPDTEKLLRRMIDGYQHPIVFDADALNIIAKHPDWIPQLPKGSILTPHPKEFERLFGVFPSDFERWDAAISLAKQHSLVIVLKGHRTLVAANGNGYFNITGNAGLAKGGSGDLLTGMITALLAQHYPPCDAAIVGVYLHGLAADLALEQQSMESLLPTDVAEYIGKAFGFLSR